MSTGEHAAVPASKPATFEADAKSLWGRVFTPAARVVIASLAVGSVATYATVSLGQSKLDALEANAARRSDAGVEAFRKEVEPRLERLERAVADVQAAAARKEERDAQRFDALYQTMITGKAQPNARELAQPMDGGR